MYGLINRGFERMVVERHGWPAWEAVRRMAGVEHEVFVTMQSYPDAVTYDLVGAASRYLGTPTDALLRDFGRYWVLHVAPESYGAIMEIGGESFVEFLENLDTVHDRVALVFTNLRQPSFRLERLAPDRLLVHYHSSRRGLAPMVVGLLEGLAERFATRVEVRHVGGPATGLDHDVFEVVLA